MVDYIKKYAAIDSNAIDKEKKRMDSLIQSGLYPSSFSFPMTLQFEVTAKCNVFCKHCYNDSGRNDGEDFERWYAGQSRYRKPENRERDREAEEASITVPEMGRLLGLDRRQAYRLVRLYGDRMEFIRIADRTKVTKVSFEAWYAGQSEYIKFADFPKKEQDRIRREQKWDKKKMPQPEMPPDKPSYSVREAVILMDLPERDVYNLIEGGSLEARKYGRVYRILREEIQWWLCRQQTDTEK